MPRTFRIFISSTFNDLKEERNALQRNVFPLLRELCNEHGYRFQAIDLRWGISNEASLNQKTMRICLEELRRCQEASPAPNFLLLLGNRYGWQPLPETLSIAGFKSVSGCSLNALESGLLNRWYMLDENAVPPIYELQPREGEFADYDRWSETEEQLRSVLSKSRTVNESLKKSATEHEIVNGLLEVKNSSEHVFCFNREFEFQIPLEQVAAENPEKSGVFFDIKRENSQAVLNRDLQQQLADLKKKIEKAIPGNVYKYRLKWDFGKIDDDYLTQLCKDVYSALSEIISKEIENEKAIGEDLFEIQQHKAFVEANWSDVLGREREIESVKSYIDNSSPDTPFVVTGDPGSGKTSLMIKSVKDSIQRYGGKNVIYRFAGLTPDSLGSEKLLFSIINEMAGMSGSPLKLKSGNLSLLQVEFNRQLEIISSGSKLVIYIDAIDMVAGCEAKIPGWIPARLPGSVKIIISGTPRCFDNDFLSAIPENNRLVPARLDMATAEKILVNLMLKRHRTLQEFQKEKVLKNYDMSGLPLYLSMAAGEAIHWRSFQENIFLQPGISGIINQVIDRLSAPDMHGSELVSKVLMFLAASKNGLTEDELLDLLIMDNDYMQFLQKHHKILVRKLPVALWARLYMDLEPYLLTRMADGTEVYDFSHQAFKNSVSERYFSSPENISGIRNTMISYYSEQKWNTGKCGTSSYGRLVNSRKTSEIVFQLQNIKDINALNLCLCDLRFIEAKCSAQGIDELLGDFSYLASFQDELSEPDRFNQYYRFVVRESDVLRQYPELTLQQAYNQKKSELVHSDAAGMLAEPRRNLSIFRLDQKQLNRNPFMWRFSSAGSGIVRFAASPSFTEFAAITRSGDLLLLDAATGRIKKHTALGMTDLNDCCFSGDGKKIAVLESNSNIHVYDNIDIQKSEVRHVSHFAERISSDQNGNLFAAWSGTDLSVVGAAGESMKFSGHFKKINHVRFDPGGTRLLSTGNDYKIYEWSIESGNETWISEDHHDQVYCLDVSSCGKYMVTSSVDEIIVWDKPGNTIIERIGIPFCSIRSVSISAVADGFFRILATGDDGYLRVFLSTEIGSERNKFVTFEPYELKLGMGPLVNSSFIPGSRDLFFVEAENGNICALELEVSGPERKHDLGSVTVIRRNPKNGSIVWGTTDGYMEFADKAGKSGYKKIHSEYMTDMVYSGYKDTFYTSGGGKCVCEINSLFPAHATVSSEGDHKKTVRCLAAIDDGKLIASADDAGIISIYNIHEKKSRQLSTGKDTPVLCMLHVPGSEILLAMDKKHFYVINCFQCKIISDIVHKVDLAYKFVHCHDRLFVVNRRGSVSSFSFRSAKPYIIFEKSFQHKPVQCNNAALLDNDILLLANSNGTIQSYQLPEVSPAGVFYAGEPVLAIDAGDKKSVIAGLASSGYRHLEYNILKTFAGN